VYQMTAGPRPREAGPAPAPRRGPPGEVVLVGAHGGAGVTTLAGLLRPAWDMGAVRRPGPGQRPLRPAGRPVVLVARSNGRRGSPRGDRDRAARRPGRAGHGPGRDRLTGCPSPPGPGTGSASWTAGSARSSASRSSPPSASPPTRSRSPCRAGHGGRSPRSARSPADRRQTRKPYQDRKDKQNAIHPPGSSSPRRHGRLPHRPPGLAVPRRRGTQPPGGRPRPG